MVQANRHGIEMAGGARPNSSGSTSAALTGRPNSTIIAPLFILLNERVYVAQRVVPHRITRIMENPREY